MKNRKALLFVIVIGVLVALVLVNRKPSETAATSPAVNQESAPEVPAEAQAPVTPPVETAKAVQEESASETVEKNLAGARKVLQQKAAIQKAKSDEVHDTPKVTIDAARRLGEIAELEAQHPEQAESFRDFYLECGRDESTMTVTRAQCLDRYIKATKLDAAAQKQFLAEFPDDIVRLVEALQ